MISAILFDLDGVLVTTDILHFQAWKELADRLGISQSYISRLEKRIINRLKKEILRLIQKFDFTKKNPKLIYINPTEERISLEDSILTAFLSLVGFDVLFFVPTGYQCIEQHFTRPFASETQIGDYLYDLRIPDFNTVQESGLHSIRKLFGRSI